MRQIRSHFVGSHSGAPRWPNRAPTVYAFSIDLPNEAHVGDRRDAALQVAKAFQAKGPAGVLSLKEVDIAIAKSLPDHMEDDAERIDKMHLDLKRLGFFWCDDVSKGLDYGRGIPSLVDYAVRVLGHEG